MRRSSSAPRNSDEKPQVSSKNFREWQKQKKEKEELEEFYGKIS